MIVLILTFIASFCGLAHAFETEIGQIKSYFHAALAIRGFEGRPPVDNTDSRLRSVTITTTVNPSDIPLDWKNGTIEADLWLLTDSPNTRAWIEAVRRILQRYPDSVNSGNLKKIILLRRLRVAGQYRAGCCTQDAIFICVERAKFETALAEVETNVHHEISSILLGSNYECFDLAAWHRLLPSKFKFGGWNALGDPMASTDKLKRDGFVIQYATTTITNDINCIAQKLMTGSDDLWQDAILYPIIYRKMQIVMNMYKCISPDMDEEYFEKLARMKCP